MQYKFLIYRSLANTAVKHISRCPSLHGILAFLTMISRYNLSLGSTSMLRWWMLPRNTHTLQHACFEYALWKLSLVKFLSNGFQELL